MPGVARVACRWVWPEQPPPCPAHRHPVLYLSRSNEHPLHPALSPLLGQFALKHLLTELNHEQPGLSYIFPHTYMNMYRMCTRFRDPSCNTQTIAATKPGMTRHWQTKQDSLTCVHTHWQTNTDTDQQGNQTDRETDRLTDGVRRGLELGHDGQWEARRLAGTRLPWTTIVKHCVRMNWNQDHSQK